ncbi:hypothetical protein DMO16_06910 [Fictibacillus sp. S7]|uniref:Uncharacterized protein n=1 Tax=Fictibacillus enclensis TaxID=1017270 RepID=A0A0V8JCM4_9BACL|nr:hypothetical protein AS030_05175 [Fictibacillus enclensis]RXY99427.1 hypothetical protein DMO16_06910 [Fictibacillus sp. S7]
MKRKRRIINRLKKLIDEYPYLNPKKTRILLSIIDKIPCISACHRADNEKNMKNMLISFIIERRYC